MTTRDPSHIRKFPPFLSLPTGTASHPWIRHRDHHGLPAFRCCGLDPDRHVFDRPFGARIPPIPRPVLLRPAAFRCLQSFSRRDDPGKSLARGRSGTHVSHPRGIGNGSPNRSSGQSCMGNDARVSCHRYRRCRRWNHRFANPPVDHQPESGSGRTPNPAVRPDLSDYGFGSPVSTLVRSRTMRRSKVATKTAGTAITSVPGTIPTRPIFRARRGTPM
mgnify:CR=1 FL=1